MNFLALLGWNEGEGSEREMYTLEELMSAFSLGRITKSGAVFDKTKLAWMNGGPSVFQNLPRGTAARLVERSFRIQTSAVVAGPERRTVPAHCMLWSARLTPAMSATAITPQWLSVNDVAAVGTCNFHAAIPRLHLGSLKAWLSVMSQQALPAER